MDQQLPSPRLWQTLLPARPSLALRHALSDKSIVFSSCASLFRSLFNALLILASPSSSTPYALPASFGFRCVHDYIHTYLYALSHCAASLHTYSSCAESHTTRVSPRSGACRQSRGGTALTPALHQFRLLSLHSLLLWHSAIAVLKSRTFISQTTFLSKTATNRSTSGNFRLCLPVVSSCIERSSCKYKLTSKSM